MGEELNRRDFLKTAAIAAGPAVITARGANDKLNIGWIGVGTRGHYGLMWLKTAAPEGVQITSICDTYEGYITRAQDRMKTLWGGPAKVYKDYREMLADKSIDAVFIMTPEHLHREMGIAALNAGKHVYLEKPIAHTIEEGWDIVKAWEKSGKICQLGTQNRSSALYKKAKEWIKQGMIGEVHYARAFWYRNNPPNNPVWRYVVPPESNEQNTDWNRFLGPAPKRPFNKNRYFQWRLYWDYSGGISTDLLVHQTDIINYMLDKTTPISCMASGGIYRWKTYEGKPDDREVPDTVSAVFEYPDNFHINYSSYYGNSHYDYGEQIMGSEGTIEVMGRKDLHFYPETYSGVSATVKARKEVHMNYKTDFKQEDDGVYNHFQNFLNSIRGTEKPIAPPPVGQEAAIGGHMATLSVKSGKKVTWNDANKKYTIG